jgi:hypothetical protein
MLAAAPNARWRRPSSALLAGSALVLAIRLLTRPASFWEYDEYLFARGVEQFDPIHHRPHPPGYPLLIGLGKLFRLAFGDSFHALVALSVVSSLVGFVALFAAFRRLAMAALPEAESAAAERIALAGALLFHLSPAMLIHGPMPMSDPPALMFLSLALWAATHLGAVPRAGRAGASEPSAESGSPAQNALSGFWPAAATGAFVSAAIGCRPQLAVALLPTLAATLLLARGARQRALVLLSFTLVSLAWFLPLLVAVGGPFGLSTLLAKQGQLVAKYDAHFARMSWSLPRLAARFIAHPWGDRWTSLPVLALAAAGIAALVRAGVRRLGVLLPLATLAVAHLTFCLAVMEPSDGVRYALPAVVAVAFAAAFGLSALLRRAPVLHASRALQATALYAVTVLLAAGFGAYAGTLLVARSTTPSPTVQAVRWAQQNLPRRTVFLVEPSLESAASYLLSDRLIDRVCPGLNRFSGKRGLPLYLLGDGESTWPDARTFRWPESDAYGKLTRNHYRVVSLSPIPPSHRYAAGPGVFLFEPNVREERFRWLAPEASLVVYPRGGRSLALTFGLQEGVPLPDNQVAVALGGAAAVQVRVERGRKARVVVPLPDVAEIAVSLRSSASFVARSTGGSADGRRVAVQLLDVEVLGV